MINILSGHREPVLDYFCLVGVFTTVKATGSSSVRLETLFVATGRASAEVPHCAGGDFEGDYRRQFGCSLFGASHQCHQGSAERCSAPDIPDCYGQRSDCEMGVA